MKTRAWATQLTHLNYDKAVRWMALVPKDIAIQQANWEVSRETRRLKELGFSTRQIANKYNIAIERVRQLITKPQTDAPIEQYLRMTSLEFYTKLRSIRKPRLQTLNRVLY